MVVVRVNVAQDDVGVGNRRLNPAKIIGSRSGHGAGALRPDLQAIAYCLIEPGYRPAPGADGACLHHTDVYPPAVDYRTKFVKTGAAGYNSA